MKSIRWLGISTILFSLTFVLGSVFSVSTNEKAPDLPYFQILDGGLFISTIFSFLIFTFKVKLVEKRINKPSDFGFTINKRPEKLDLLKWIGFTFLNLILIFLLYAEFGNFDQKFYFLISGIFSAYGWGLFFNIVNWKKNRT